MSEYTPTTPVVAGHYAWKSTSIVGAKDYGAAKTEFDRWLVEHDREVRDDAFRVASAIALTYNKGYSQHPDDKPWEAAKSRISEAILTQVEGY